MRVRIRTLCCILVIFLIFIILAIYLCNIPIYTEYLKQKKINEILEQQRSEIKAEMHNYPYIDGLYGSKLSDFISEEGGKPLRNVIITNWRSGSSFFGDILNTHPATFYIFEPLFYLGTIKIRGSSLVDESLKTLKSFFNCNYTSIEHVLKTNTWKNAHRNRYLKNLYKDHGDLYENTDFMSRFCHLFPFQTTKIVGLQLHLAEMFLKNEALGIKIIYLVRDPRGIMHSREDLDWCQNTTDCSDPAVLCWDMKSDYEAALKFSKLYPEKFRVLRYEDLARNPYKHSINAFNFYGLFFHDNVREFVKTHTTVSSNKPYATFRNSNATVFKWRKEMSFHKVNNIQRNCDEAMKHWGYKLALNQTHQENFYPLNERMNYTEIIFL